MKLKPAMESDERGRSEPEVPETDVKNEYDGQRNFVTAKDEEQVAEEESNSNREGEAQTAAFNRKDMLKAIEVVERDSLAIAQSYTSLFASLRSALSEVSPSISTQFTTFSNINLLLGVRLMLELELSRLSDFRMFAVFLFKTFSLTKFW